MSGLKKDSPKIAVIAGFKASDAALCLSLEQAFSNVKIARYRIPFERWLSWIFKKISDIGAFVLMGHLLLSLFLRSQRLFEKLFRKSLWLKYNHFAPSWSLVKSPKQVCFSEQQVIEFIRGAETIVFLDSVRFSHNFYRQFKIPILQIIWSNSPEYYGDSGAFWAYSVLDYKNVGASVILRKASFDKADILDAVTIPHNGHDDLRTIKIKQVLAICKILPQAIIRSLNTKAQSSYQKVHCRIFRPPTFFTYLTFLKNHSLRNIPSYAFKKAVCKIREN